MTKVDTGTNILLVIKYAYLNCVRKFDINFESVLDRLFEVKNVSIVYDVLRNLRNTKLLISPVLRHILTST